jgi:hypothetical protein
MHAAISHARPRPTRRFVSLVLLIAVCLAAQPAAAGFYRPRGCITFYLCHTTLSRRHVRVYQVVPRPPREPVNYDETYALWLPSHRVTALGDKVEEGNTEPGLARISLGGEYVAYALTGSSVFREESAEGLTWQIWRLNVKTGRDEKVRREHKCVAADLSEGWDAPGVSDLLVTPQGTMAWMFGSYNTFPTSYRVCVTPPGTTSPLLLASSPAIAPKSLAIAAGRLSWVENGETRSAPLPRTPQSRRAT